MASESKGGEDATMVPATAATKRFEVKKWNAVALWAWDIQVESCAICRNHIMDLCEATMTHALYNCPNLISGQRCKLQA
jgi:cytidine deaminase